MNRFMHRVFKVAFLLLCYSLAYAEASCHPKLWQNTITMINLTDEEKNKVIKVLYNQSIKPRQQAMQALSVLSSAGKTSIHDQALIATRNALQSSDYASVKALLYSLNHDAAFLNQTREILLNWATINHPTGNPIDETRLEGLIWAYDLIACDISKHDRWIIMHWFKQIANKKRNYYFGAKTSKNNHRIHQLKMLLLLDKVLNDTVNWHSDLIAAKEYSSINIDPSTGISVDFLERSSLYYHTYDLEPWLEIQLITRKHFPPVTKAFDFLIRRIRQQNIAGEFLHSTAKIDALRAQGGFAYAKPGGVFDVRRAAPVIISYYTLLCRSIPKDLSKIVSRARVSPRLSFLKARQLLWCQAI